MSYAEIYWYNIYCFFVFLENIHFWRLYHFVSVARTWHIDFLFTTSWENILSICQIYSSSEKILFKVQVPTNNQLCYSLTARTRIFTFISSTVFWLGVVYEQIHPFPIKLSFCWVQTVNKLVASMKYLPRHIPIWRVVPQDFWYISLTRKFAGHATKNNCIFWFYNQISTSSCQIKCLLLAMKKNLMNCVFFTLTLWTPGAGIPVFRNL